MREKEELTADRKKLMESVIETEQLLQERIRDLELKDIKIDSLQAIINKRDQ